MNAEQVARLFGCTVEQAKALYAKNAAQLSSMARTSKATGRKVNNYTEATLRRLAEAAQQRSK